MREAFVETVEHRRFAEFCDACRHYRYIGLCYGSPGVGKTLSARRYAGWEVLAAVDVYRLSDAEVRVLGTPTALFYTPGVVNTPRSIGDEIGRGRGLLHRIALESFHRAQRAASAKPRVDDERQRNARFHFLGVNFAIIWRIFSELFGARGADSVWLPHPTLGVSSHR